MRPLSHPNIITVYESPKMGAHKLPSSDSTGAMLRTENGAPRQLARSPLT